MLFRISYDDGRAIAYRVDLRYGVRAATANTPNAVLWDDAYGGGFVVFVDTIAKGGPVELAPWMVWAACLATRKPRVELTSAGLEIARPSPSWPTNMPMRTTRGWTDGAPLGWAYAETGVAA